MSKKLCVISTKNPTDILIECINNVLKYYPDFDLLVVDSNSDKTDGFSKIPANVKLDLIKNTNWELGAWLYAYNNYEYDIYMFIQDSLVPIYPVDLSDIETSVYSFNYTARLKDGDHLASHTILKNIYKDTKLNFISETSGEDRILGCAHSSFIANRANTSKILELERVYVKNKLVKTKIDCWLSERSVGMVMDNYNMNRINIIKFFKKYNLRRDYNINTELEEGINKLISKIPIYVYFHICMINNWVSIVKDILNKIKESGLYDIIDQIRCFCLGDKKNFPEDILDSKMKIHFDSNTKLYERFTLNNLYKDANKEEFICLYLHSKGITRMGNKNVKDWVDYLIHFNISRHVECLKILETNDCVGVNLAKDQIHYSGNFWWSKSSHIKQLNMKIGDRYNDPEFWICTKKENVSYANIYSSNINHYNIPFPENMYKNNEIKLEIMRLD